MLKNQRQLQALRFTLPSMLQSHTIKLSWMSWGTNKMSAGHARRLQQPQSQCLKNPQPHFNIIMSSLLVSPPDRSLILKFKSLIQIFSNTNVNYIDFTKVVKLWNALPVVNISLCTPVLECKSKLVSVVAFFISLSHWQYLFLALFMSLSSLVLLS